MGLVVLFDRTFSREQLNSTLSDLLAFKPHLVDSPAGRGTDAWQDGVWGRDSVRLPPPASNVEASPRSAERLYVAPVIANEFLVRLIFKFFWWGDNRNAERSRFGCNYAIDSSS